MHTAKRATNLILAVATCWISTATTVNAQENLPELSGPYLGQVAPGQIAKLFAPGIISTKGWELNGTFSATMNEYYHLRGIERDGIFMREFVVYQNKDSHWTRTVLSPRIGEPAISPDGNTMHLGKNYKSRTQSGWSEMKSLGPDFDQYMIMRLTSSAKGMYVFDEATRDGTGVLRYARMKGGAHEAPKPLPETINTGRWNAHPFIAPDESYILWDGQRDTLSDNADIFISFRQKDGSWGRAIKLPVTVNTEKAESSATVSPDGKYLFFNRSVGKFDVTPETGQKRTISNVDVYWVSTTIIEDLRPKD